LQTTILQPAAILVLWTLVMLGWMLLTRMPALRALGVTLDKLVGTKGADADRSLPAKAQWKAHNYNHLMEQPTLFYATTGILALSGVSDAATVLLAWAYVAFRIAHSVWQATVNRVSVRFALFAASSAVLVILALRAVVGVF
jgi:hypothetical protein